jgi:hypothetical protein
MFGGDAASDELLHLALSNLPSNKLLDKLYAKCAARQARDDGTEVIAPIQQRRGVSVTFLKDQCPSLAPVAARLLSMHMTACSSEQNWSKWGLLLAKNRASFKRETAEQIIFVAQNTGNSTDVDTEELFEAFARAEKNVVVQHSSS